MVISPEQALSLLRKWFEEKTLLKVMVVPSSGLFTVRMMGFIGALASDCVMIGDQSDRDHPPQHYIEVNPTACRFYDYLETKDLKNEPEAVKQYLAKQHGIASLSIVLSDKTRLSLFEQGD